MFEWKCVIEGIRPISKKNSRVHTLSSKSLPSAAYKKFNTAALAELLPQTPPKPYDGDLHVEIDVYMKGKLTADIDNLQNSWLDTLEDARVYLNDDQVVSIVARKHRGAKDWRTEIRVSAIEQCLAGLLS